MKYLIYIVLALPFLSTACTEGFEELNTNPNAPTEAEPALLLRQVIYDYGEEMSYEGFVAGNLLGQYFAMVDFNLFDRHSLSDPQLGGNPWPVLYTNLRDNEIMLKSARANPSDAVYEGPALILKAYITAALTDIYGDVPYTEALQGTEGNITPAYDTQERIYTGADGILDNLDQGIAAIEHYSGNLPLEGDILFNGNLDAWVTFANSLKIKYLMRISARQDVSSELQRIYSEGNYIATNAQNATFSFTSGRPNSFRMQQLRDGDFNLFVLSETMEEILKGLDDPRIEVLFRPVGNDPTGTEYRGLLNGPDASQTSISVADYSRAGTIFREHTGDLDANFTTASETHFLLAEAAERGLISANPQTHYETGVQLAFEYWQTPLPPSYLSTGSGAYGSNGANKIEQIITQKWIANIINGYEGWIEYRRTGFPQLKPVAASLNNNLFPLRMPYPTDETVLNSISFGSATGARGNSVNERVWWDVN
ncbi:MAG: SusD/RagB family nutrient-binding outer membrane lipoprotein [Candidatus Kapaibacterium sp.]